MKRRIGEGWMGRVVIHAAADHMESVVVVILVESVVDITTQSFAHPSRPTTLIVSSSL